MSDLIEYINMQSRGIVCHICGQDSAHEWGVPIYNGDIVSNSFPDDLWSEGGGGVAVCESCFNKHAQGEIPTFDRLYIPKGRSFIHGDGI